MSWARLGDQVEEHAVPLKGDVLHPPPVIHGMTSMRPHEPTAQQLAHRVMDGRLVDVQPSGDLVSAELGVHARQQHQGLLLRRVQGPLSPMRPPGPRRPQASVRHGDGEHCIGDSSSSISGMEAFGRAQRFAANIGETVLGTFVSEVACPALT